MPFGKTVLLGVVAGAYVGLCAALLMTGAPLADGTPCRCFPDEPGSG